VLRFALHDRDRFDFDEKLGSKEPLHLHRRTRGRGAHVDVLVALVSKLGEMREIEQVTVQFDHVAEASTRSFDGRVEVREHLPNLSLEVVFADETAGLIEGNLTGDEDDCAAPGHGQLRIPDRPGHRVGADQLNVSIVCHFGSRSLVSFRALGRSRVVRSGEERQRREYRQPCTCHMHRLYGLDRLFSKSMSSIKRIDTTNLSAIDLNLLAALESLLAEAGVGRAAVRMNLSQPAMSHALKRLRQLFRDPLLVRVGARMQLTSRAESLRFPVEDALARVRDLFAGPAFDPAHSERTFRLSISDNASGVLLPRVLARLAQDAPRVAIRLLPPSIAGVNPVDLSRQVEAIVACSPGQFTGFYQQRLFEDRDACATRSGHPLAARMTPERFFSARHVAVVAREFAEDPVDTWLREEGCARTVVLTVSTYLEALHVVAESDLVAVVPERLIDAHAALLDLVATEVPLDAGTFEEYLLHPARTHADPGCVWLRSLIREIATSLGRLPRHRRRRSVAGTRRRSRSDQPRSTD
jgi:DNA-binding transcriptional LysR family regulator